MNQQHDTVEGVHKHIIERYPMYVANGGFEQWLQRKAGTDEKKIHAYLDMLDSYGYINGDGTLSGDYDQLPDPEHVVDDIGRRLDRLDAPALAVLSAGSIEGEHFCAETVAAIGDIGESEVRGALDAAERAGVVAPDGSEALYCERCQRYRFVPLQTRDLLYRKLAEEERVRLHDAFVAYLGEQLERTEDAGRREMIDRMISEHHDRAARPEPSPSKQ